MFELEAVGGGAASSHTRVDHLLCGGRGTALASGYKNTRQPLTSVLGLRLHLHLLNVQVNGYKVQLSHTFCCGLLERDSCLQLGLGGEGGGGVTGYGNGRLAVWEWD